VTHADQLVDKGYAIVRTSNTIHSDGIRSETISIAGYQQRVRPDGSFNYDPPDMTTVSFGYLDQRGTDPLSPIAKRFADALISILVPGHEPKRLFRRQHPVDESTPRPLVMVTPTSVWIIYRNDGLGASLRLGPPTFDHGRDLFRHGIQTRDRSDVLGLRADCREIPIDAADSWIDGRSPLTVPRSSVASWNENETALALYNLVEQWVNSGDLRECEGYKEPPLKGGYSPAAMLAREGITIGVPADEWTGEAPGELWRERGRWG
jgi:hypothetical protein